MRLRLIAVFALILGTLFLANSTLAHAAATISPEVVERVKARCVENKTSVERLHQTDAFIRNERGNLYRTIGDKLMVPLNKRIASNQLDGGALLTTASDYNNEYSRFYRAYIDYDIALGKVLDIDCTREPVAFYNGLLDARNKRVKLSESTVKIKELIRQYGVSFTDFKTNFEKENS